MLKKLLITLTGILLMGGTSAAEQLTMTTYYPAPYCRYMSCVMDQFQLVQQSGSVSGGCTTPGSILFDDNGLNVCSPSSQWGTISGVWSQDKTTGAGAHNYLYTTEYADTTQRVGIGTNAPEYKLHLAQDGGILATGTFNSGVTMTTAGAGTRLIWYPRKAAFRAGNVTGTGWNETSIGNYSFATGRDTTASGANSVSLGDANLASGSNSAILGGSGNSATGSYALVVGGESNSSSTTKSTIVGGVSNTASGQYSFIGGGGQNIATGSYSFIGGGGNVTAGFGNEVRGIYSSMAGGYDNIINAGSDYGFLGGGYQNQISSDWVTLGGGRENTATATYAVVGGGYSNDATSTYAVVTGGISNTASALYSTVGGGYNNLASGSYSVVAGGGSALSANGNTASGSYSFVGGGINNKNAGIYSAIVAGSGNSINGNGFIGAGQNNTIASGSSGAIVTGVGSQVNASWSTILGGNNNVAGVSEGVGIHSVVLNGVNNQANGDYTMVGTGHVNRINGAYSWTGVGDTVTIDGTYSFAGPKMIDLNGNRSFVWDYHSSLQQIINNNDAFLVFPTWTAGQMGIGTTVLSTNKLTVGGNTHVAGNITATGSITPFSSDEYYKKNIAPIDNSLEKIEKIRGVYFDWKTEDFPQHHFREDRDIGLIAQDVQEAFPELVMDNTDGKKTVDYMKLVAPLIEAVKELNHKADRLEQENLELKNRLQKLERQAP